MVQTLERLQERECEMDTSFHGPGGGNTKVLKRAATVPATATVTEKFESVPERVASAPAVLSQIEKGKSQQQQKPALKKPSKLAPCPRCESLETKFCYYNNYNINQPRYFCKNCQRYWTAGGTLRNVPVGAGRRKNKHGSLQARHGGLPEQQVRLEPSLSVMAQPRPRNQFAPEQISSPLASSSSYPLHTAEAARQQYIPAEPQANLPSDHGRSRLHDEKEDCEGPCTSEGPCASSAPSQSSSEMDATQEVQSTNRVPAATTATPPQPGIAVPGLGGVPDGSIWTAGPAPFGLFNGSWPFGYNVGWSSGAAGQPTVGGITTWSPPPNALWPGVCWGSAIIPGMPPGLVGSPWVSPGWTGGWGVPWPGAEAVAAADPAAKPPTTGVSSRLPIRPVLSKHPRDRSELEPLWIPKLAKLNDPGTVPRSSVWTAVGAEHHHQLDSPGSNFKAFLPVRKASATSDGNTVEMKS